MRKKAGNLGLTKVGEIYLSNWNFLQILNCWETNTDLSNLISFLTTNWSGNGELEGSPIKLCSKWPRFGSFLEIQNPERLGESFL